MICVNEGDLGDAVLTLGVVSGVPNGPHRFLLQKSSMTKYRTDLDVSRFCKMFKPLADVQPYINECRERKDGERVDWDSGGFRLANLHQRTETLLSAHRRHYLLTRGGNCGDGMTPWLVCCKSPKTRGRVVVNRTERYRNPHFPWRKIVEFYGSKIVFVGSPHEHSQFCAEFGSVDYLHTFNLLDLAEVIAGSSLFIGNQSVGNAVAEGLKHPMIQETSLEIPDCVFKRDNAQHCYDGRCVLPSIDERAPQVCGRARPPTNSINLKTVPPGRWMLKKRDGRVVRDTFFTTVLSMAKQDGISKEELLEQNIDANFDYFYSVVFSRRFDVAETALRTAGITPNTR